MLPKPIHSLIDACSKKYYYNMSLYDCFDSFTQCHFELKFSDQLKEETSIWFHDNPKFELCNHRTTSEICKDIKRLITEVFDNIIKEHIVVVITELRSLFLQRGLIITEKTIDMYMPEKLLINEQNTIMCKGNIVYSRDDEHIITYKDLKAISTRLMITKERLAAQLANIGFKFEIKNEDFKKYRKLIADVDMKIKAFVNNTVIDPHILIDLANQKIQLSSKSCEQKYLNIIKYSYKDLSKMNIYNIKVVDCPLTLAIMIISNMHFAVQFTM